VVSLSMDDFATARTAKLEDFATVHDPVSTVSELFERIDLFKEDKWAFRGQGADHVLSPSIERVAIRPGLGGNYVEREFRRRAHQYVADVPSAGDDLEWLALMQHHGAPTRLLDWTKSAHVAAFFAAQSSNLANSFIITKPEKSVEPFVIWAVDVESINAEAAEMLGLAPNNDLSSRENFRKIYKDQQPQDLYLVAAVQPYRMNERLTIQQGLFLCASHPLLSFRRCFVSLLLHARNRNKPSSQWLHKLVVAAETRLDVLKALNKININSATLFPGLDGFSRWLLTDVQTQELGGNLDPSG
jgi:hypothetical protein